MVSVRHKVMRLTSSKDAECRQGRLLSLSSFCSLRVNQILAERLKLRADRWPRASSSTEDRCFLILLCFWRAFPSKRYRENTIKVKPVKGFTYSNVKKFLSHSSFLYIQLQRAVSEFIQSAPEQYFLAFWRSLDVVLFIFLLSLVAIFEEMLLLTNLIPWDIQNTPNWGD